MTESIEKLLREVIAEQASVIEKQKQEIADLKKEVSGKQVYINRIKELGNI